MNHDAAEYARLLSTTEPDEPTGLDPVVDDEREQLRDIPRSGVAKHMGSTRHE